MDPNKTWQEIVRLLNLSEEEGDINEEEAFELKNHISNLYGWIKRGGFVPKELESLNGTACLFVLKSMWELLE